MRKTENWMRGQGVKREVLLCGGFSGASDEVIFEQTLIILKS